MKACVRAHSSHSSTSVVNSLNQSLPHEVRLWESTVLSFQKFAFFPAKIAKAVKDLYGTVFLSFKLLPVFSTVCLLAKSAHIPRTVK